MPTKRLSREEKKAATREALLKAGVKVLARRGFSASLEEFAEAAGYSKGAIYSNFASRDEFMIELLERVTPGSGVEPDRGAASFEDAVAGAVERVIHRLEHDPSSLILSVDFFLLALRTPSLRRRVRRERAKYHEHDALRLGSLAESFGVDPPLPPDQLSTALDAVGVGLALYRIFYGPEVVPDDLFQHVYRRVARP